MKEKNDNFVKQYNFDYIEEDLLKNIDNIRDIETWVRTLPFGLFFWIWPPTDPNGEEVEDLELWHKQREEFISSLLRFCLRFR